MRVPVSGTNVTAAVRAKRLAKRTLEAVSALRPGHWPALQVLRSDLKPRLLQAPAAEHLRSAIDWLKCAQDATDSGGCAWGYRARARVRSGERTGWQPAYPETSGYIIETLLRYGRRAGDRDAIERARRMADWELSLQLADGGMQGGVIGAPKIASSTFVTGQVLFGWLAAFDAFGDRKYLDAAYRAGDYLVSCLDGRGRFTKGFSYYCMPGPKAYESRTGWALALLGRHKPVYSAAAGAIAEFALSCQQPNGWFRENDLSDPSAPLTHTIGYVLEGLLETGNVLGDCRHIERVRPAMENIQPLIREDGFLPGRLTADWQPAAAWCCLTGSCQLARVFLRMETRYPGRGFAESGGKLLAFVASTQVLGGAKPWLSGGIRGSFPFDGDYNPYCLPNWATKFYADAVMEYLDAAC